MFSVTFCLSVLSHVGIAIFLSVVLIISVYPPETASFNSCSSGNPAGNPDWSGSMTLLNGDSRLSSVAANIREEKSDGW